MKQKIILVILDGLGDRPDPQLNDQTPLEAARKPYFNFMAQKGITGLIDPVGVGQRPGSDTAHLSLLGYDPHQYYPGRGPLEAAGIGINLKPGDVAFRVDLATLDSKGKIVDRRAGRMDSVACFESALNKIRIPGFVFSFKAGIGHRGVLVVSGNGVSARVSETDPYVIGEKELEMRSLDSSAEAVTTARAVNEYLRQARKTLSQHSVNKKRKAKKEPVANTLLLRGAGVFSKIPSFEEKHGLKAACVASSIYKGIAKSMGMDVIEVVGANGKKDTNILSKFAAAKQALLKKDFVFVHIKGTDEYGHDGDALGKKAFIERVDSAARELLTLDNTIIAITGDHSTPCQLNAHSGDPVPIIIFGRGVRKDNIERFGERDCARGGLGRINGLSLMQELLNLADRQPIYGA